MKKGKAFLSIILALAICSSLPVSAAEEKTELDFVFEEIEENKSLSEQLFGEQSDFYNTTSNSVSIRFSDDKESLLLTLNYNGGTYQANLPGDIENITSDSVAGYVGIYEGEMVSAEGLPAAHIIVDAVFTENEMFAALTIGYVQEDNPPKVLFFGEYSDCLKKITDINYNESLETNDTTAVSESDVLQEPATIFGVNAAGRFQGQKNLCIGGVPVGTMCVIHPDEIRNSGVGEVYVKVSSMTSAAESYIKNNMGYASLAEVFPETVNARTQGNDSELFATEGTWVPGNKTDTFDLKVPIFPDPSDLHTYETISLKLVMAKSTVTAEKYPTTSNNFSNRVTWEIYKKGGLGDIDGDAYTNGLPVRVQYSYQGNVHKETTATMTETASIRYGYRTLDTGTLILHVSTGTGTLTTYWTIKP